MSRYHFAVPFFLAAAVCANCVAADFELTIRAHVDRVKFYDPLYIEVTLVNRGTEAIVGSPLSMLDGSLGLKVYDEHTRLSMPIGETGGSWGSQPVRYRPDQPQKFYCRVFLPDLHGFDHPFWKPMRANGQRVFIGASYAIHKRLSLLSNSIEVRVDPRDKDELQTLEHWANAALPHPGDGPRAQSFGLRFKSVLTRTQMTELADRLNEGEMHDLLLLAIHLRDIYDTPPDSRDAKNRGLVEWLKKLPDIKRQCLIDEVRGVAEGHRLRSTAEAVGQLIDWK